MTPFRTIYSDIDSDIVPSINIIRYTHKALNINNLLPSESIFENYKGYEIVLQNYTNNESILVNFNFIICIYTLLIIISILSIIIVCKCKIKHVNQSSLTDPPNIELELALDEGKSSPKIVL